VTRATDLDPKMTFDAFVVGPANRVASTAARAAAGSPGESRIPLFVFIHSASGLGKTHILSAVAHEATRGDHGRKVLYQVAETYLEDVADAIREGRQKGLRERLGSLDILLLDDVQFLAGQREAQEMLLSTLDALTASGRHLMLASDRPPDEIEGLGVQLLSRSANGLIVDIAPPEYETSIAIARRLAEDRGQRLQPGVAEALARYAFRNVRELRGALNRVLATQELEERSITPAEVAHLMGGPPLPPQVDPGPVAENIADDPPTPAERREEPEEEPWRRGLRQAAAAAEREGFVARRLRAFLQREDAPRDWEDMLARFQEKLVRLRAIDAELERLGAPRSATGLNAVRDPERVDEAEALLASARERHRPFGVLGPGPTLGDLDAFVPLLALKAAEQIVRDESPPYNPLFFWGDPPSAAKALLGSAARSYRAVRPYAKLAVASVAELAEDFARARNSGVPGAWRERWGASDLLLIHGLEALGETGTARDEFFILFEALKRRGSRVLLAADRSPSLLEGIDPRMRSRFEEGLVLQVMAAEELPAGADDLTVHPAEPDGDPPEPA
jgi:chromosomal replication initiation ATPase DnaA